MLPDLKWLAWRGLAGSAARREANAAIKGRMRSNAAEAVREAVFAGMGLAVASEWMFGRELAAGRVRRVLADWELPPVDLWVVFPSGRNASMKARAFANFIEQDMRADFGDKEGAGC